MKKFLIILAIFMIFGALSGYLLIMNNKENIITMDGLRPQKNMAEFSRDADVILIGIVKEELPAVQDPDTGYIYRKNIINVEKFLKNSQTSSDIAVNLYGGKIGNLDVQIGGEKEIKLIPGTRVLLFLGNDKITKEDGDFWIYSAPDGLFTLDSKNITIGSDNEKQKLADLERIIADHKDDKKSAIKCNPAFSNINMPDGYSGPDAYCFKQSK